MRQEERVLERPGARLHYDVYQPDAGEPSAVVLVVHGLAEHAARYRRLAEALTARGWEVRAHDQRGHGRTAGGDEGLGSFGDANGWDTVVSDLRALVELAKSEHPGRPIAVVAHSMGSLVLQGYLTRYRAADLSAAALSGTSGPPPAIASAGRVVARGERWRQGGRGRSAVIDKLAFGAYNKAFAPARTDFDWLSRDPAEVDAYVADPWCGFRATNQLWVDLLDALPQLSKPERVEDIPKKLPIYLVSGDRDPVGENGRGVEELVRRYRAAGIEDVTLKLWPDARHEVFNESNREEVVAELVSWLGSKIG